MIRRPPRSTRTDTLFPYTTLFRAPGACAAATSALMFDPRPEIRMPTRLRSAMVGGGPARPRAPDLGRTGDRAAPWRFRDRADAVHRLARRLQRLRHRRGLSLRDHHGHADAAVEGARHLLRLDIPKIGQAHV